MTVCSKGDFDKAKNNSLLLPGGGGSAKTFTGRKFPYLCHGVKVGKILMDNIFLYLLSWRAMAGKISTGEN